MITNPIWKWTRKPTRCERMACCSPANPPKCCPWRSAIFCFSGAVMLEVFEVLKHPFASTMTVVLTFDERQKSRYKTTTTCGREMGWFIERGTVLQDGDYLKCKTGEVISVI